LLKLRTCDSLGHVFLLCNQPVGIVCKSLSGKGTEIVVKDMLRETVSTINVQASLDCIFLLLSYC